MEKIQNPFLFIVIIIYLINRYLLIRDDKEILKEEEFSDYFEFLEWVQDTLSNFDSLSDPDGTKKIIKEIISSSIKFSIEISNAGDFFEAADFLQTTAELVEEIDYEKARGLYIQTIKNWKNLIDDLIIHAKLHEIAEIYLRIADIYASKFKDFELERKAILNSIKYLNDESNIFKEFNEIRKLAQNYSNIAELYVKLKDYRNAIDYYKNVIEISKYNEFIDLLSFSYQQIAVCFEEIDKIELAKDFILDGIDFFTNLYNIVEEKNEYLSIAQLSQILKSLYRIMGDREFYIIYSKKEAGAYINLAEGLEKANENLLKIARYYRGAGLCYQEIDNNLIECASCFMLAGNYSIDPNEAALNYFDAANTFKELDNFEMAYKNFVKAGDNFWKAKDVYQSTENYLNAYDIAVETDLEFNRYGIFDQIVRGLNKVAEDGLKNKQFFTAASLILESIKFYEQLDTAKDFLLKEMVRNVYKYYYRAASLKKIGFSHIVQSYVMAALCCVLRKDYSNALEILTELDSEGNTINIYKEMVELVINWVSNGEQVDIEKFPFKIQRLIQGSEELEFIINLYKRL
ncbi:MAG: hypothetical protein ACTSR8_21940 [Promethearchaeota archaeon]